MLQDYPEHRLQFFNLLRSITNACFGTLFTMSPGQLKLVIDSIVWAFRHTERNVADTGVYAPLSCDVGESCVPMQQLILKLVVGCPLTHVSAHEHLQREQLSRHDQQAATATSCVHHIQNLLVSSTYRNLGAYLH